MIDTIEERRRTTVKDASFIIVARGANGVIGNGPLIPWSHSADMRHFRNATLGCVLVVGRTTFDTLPRTMPGRSVVVLTSRPIPNDRDAIVADTFEAAVEAAMQTGARAIAFAGGPRIYQKALDLDWLRKAIVTEISASPEGDARMPDMGPSWVPGETTSLVSSEGEPEARVVLYDRHER